MDLSSMNDRPRTCVDVETICSFVIQCDGQMRKNECDALFELAKHVTLAGGLADLSYTSGGGFLWDLVIHERRIRVMKKQHEYDMGLTTQP